jgi:hypothetical protein
LEQVPIDFIVSHQFRFPAEIEPSRSRFLGKAHRESTQPFARAKGGQLQAVDIVAGYQTDEHMMGQNSSG